MDEMEVKIRATKSQIEEFKDSVLWEDIIEEMNRWKEMFQRDYDGIANDCVSGEITGSTALVRLGDIHGRGKAIDYFISIPEVFIQILEEKKDESGHK